MDNTTPLNMNNPQYLVELDRAAHNCVDVDVCLGAKSECVQVFKSGADWRDKRPDTEKEEIRKALEPLAKLADAVFRDTNINKTGPLYQFNGASITYEDLRAAQTAINQALGK